MNRSPRPSSLFYNSNSSLSPFYWILWWRVCLRKESLRCRWINFCFSGARIHWHVHKSRSFRVITDHVVADSWTRGRYDSSKSRTKYEWFRPLLRNNSHFCDEFDTNSEMETWTKTVNDDDDKDDADDYCRSVAVSMASISEPKVHMSNFFRYVSIATIVTVIARKSLWNEQEWMIEDKSYSLCYRFSLIQFGLGPIADFSSFPSIRVCTRTIQQYVWWTIRCCWFQVVIFVMSNRD